MTPKLRKGRCKLKGCGVAYETLDPKQQWCSIEHGVLIAQAKLAAKKAKEAHQERQKDRAKLESMKTRSDWMKEAQKAFNAYIRARDADNPCICCGLPLDMGTYSRGGSYDAGHYRSVGSAPHLRFDERNCHAQRKQCNQYGGGRAVDYRIGLIKRIGFFAVQELEADQTAKKWTIEELKAIKALYVGKLKELQRQRRLFMPLDGVI